VNTRWSDHLYIFMTILLTVYSQIVMRWQVVLAGQLPADLNGKILFILRLLINPWVVTGIVATFFSGIAWMLAMTKFEISYAFPFVSLNFVLVLGISALMLNEPFTLAKALGTTLVVLGIVVLSKFA